MIAFLRVSAQYIFEDLVNRVGSFQLNASVEGV